MKVWRMSSKKRFVSNVPFSKPRRSHPYFWLVTLGRTLRRWFRRYPHRALLQGTRNKPLSICKDFSTYMYWLHTEGAKSVQTNASILGKSIWLQNLQNRRWPILWMYYVHSSVFLLLLVLTFWRTFLWAVSFSVWPIFPPTPMTAWPGSLPAFGEGLPIPPSLTLNHHPLQTSKSIFGHNFTKVSNFGLANFANFSADWPLFLFWGLNHYRTFVYHPRFFRFW